MFKKDAIWFGLLAGIILPCLFYGLLYLVSMILRDGTYMARIFHSRSIMLLAVAINFIPIRLYFVNLKFDKTGRGILFMTFLLVIAYFIIIKYF